MSSADQPAEPDRSGQHEPKPDPPLDSSEGNSSADELSRDEFAQRMLEALRQAGAVSDAQYDQQEFRLQIVGPVGTHTFNLTNVFSEHCRVAPEDRQSHFDRVVRAALSPLVEMPDEFQHAAPDLRPAVRSRFFLDRMELEANLENRPLPVFPHVVLGEHLAVHLAYDMPDSLRLLDQSQLDQWDVSLWEALEVSKQNMFETDINLLSVEGGFYMTPGDTYDSALILHTDLLRSLEVQGDLLVMVPSRDKLLITGTEFSDGLTLMVGLGGEALAGPRPVCGIPFRLVGEEFEPWHPQDDHEFCQQFRELEVRSLGPEYAEQKQLLEEIHQQEETDLFVATYSALRQQESQRIFSYAVWGEGVETLMPRTHRIALIAENQGFLGMADWDQVMAVAGDLFEPVALYPPRWLVKEFPSPEQISAIGPVREDDQAGGPDDPENPPTPQQFS